MGRSYTPKYIVKVRHVRPMIQSTDSSWNSKQTGRPTEKNLAAFVEKYHQSIEPGGCNAHLTEAFGNARLTWAAICLNDGKGTVVAEWRA